MQASLTALVLALLLSGGWMLSRRRARPFLRSTDTSDVVALNRAQIERLRERAAAGPTTADSPAELGSLPAREVAVAATVPVPPLPQVSGRPAPRAAQLRQWQAWLRGTREQRLQAVAMADRSRHRSALPLLRRALRDPDPAVMAAAVIAIERYRGRSQAFGFGQAPMAARRQAGSMARPLPLRVSRTR